MGGGNCIRRNKHNSRAVLEPQYFSSISSSHDAGYMGLDQPLVLRHSTRRVVAGLNYSSIDLMSTTVAWLRTIEVIATGSTTKVVGVPYDNLGNTHESCCGCRSPFRTTHKVVLFRTTHKVVLSLTLIALRCKSVMR